MLRSDFYRFFRRIPAIAITSAIGGLPVCSVLANPLGATVTQGTASISSAGSKESIQTSDRAFINWQSFNIGAGETTTFIQPSSTSLVWNQINDANPSQILGTLNANGYIVLQNQSGFYIGGQASISAQGFIMTTAPIPMPDLSGGGAWQFDAPPPTASIINYGQISAGPGGSAFLIANKIENHGEITAPGGNLGLYAGKSVLVSTRPDGRGLSATVTLPQGSVDNTGRLIADGGTIALNAQVVNQGGLIQANSVQEHDGVIDLIAGNSLNLAASSVISAKGGAQGMSAGGTVSLKSGNTFQDSTGSLIDVSGGAQGGNGGQIEISAPQMSAIHSTVAGRAAAGFQAGALSIDPDKIVLADSGDAAPGSGTVNAGDPPSAGSPDTLTLDVNSLNSLITDHQLSMINLSAGLDIEVSTMWNVPDSQTLNSLISLTAGRNIILDDGGGINAGLNWSLSLTAGPNNLTSRPAAGVDGIYLNGSIQDTFLQTQNGNINLWAANEIQIMAGSFANNSLVAHNAIRTMAGGNTGGNITAVTQFGDINTGNNTAGFLFKNKAPFYTVDPSLGGISTAAGGNVDIEAGGDVRGYLPTSISGDHGNDAGSGAFGPQSGNVTVKAGGNIYGHYVLANGTGSLTAQGNVGGQSLGDNVALSLIKGNWTVDAPNGSIYLMEVRNPNGTYNNTTRGIGSIGANPNHLFDYDPAASVTLDAGGVVDLLTTPGNLPRLDGQSPFAVPVLFPPSLSITAGTGGIFLASQLTLFPSALGELQINDAGSFVGPSSIDGTVELLMSDSAAKNVLSTGTTGTFSDTDHGPVPTELNNLKPVVIHVGGNLDGVALDLSKKAVITVDGDIVNSSFSGQNLHANDHTTITVGGAIRNAPSFSSVTLPQGPAFVPPQDLPPGLPNQFDTLLNLAVDPTAVGNVVIPSGTPRIQVEEMWASLLLISTENTLTSLPDFGYNATTGKLSFLGRMTPQLISLLQQPTITVVQFADDGFPAVDNNGKFITQTITWADSTQLAKLITESAQTAIAVNNGIRIGGPGTLDVNAGSLSLGDSIGILSLGAIESGLTPNQNRYRNLASFTPTGADVNVKVTGDIDMLTSTIASLAGGNVSVISTGGNIDLGSPDTLVGDIHPPLGVFVTGTGGNVSVSAHGNVNIDGSRIAAYDGGDVTVNSDTGNVDAGSGGATAANINTDFVDPLTLKPSTYLAGVYGSGILATTLVDPTQVPGSPTKPGNIIVTTPEGDIKASLGGILQEALNGSISAGPTITLKAGTFAADGTPHAGNIDLGDSGVIGGTVNLSANGNISGLIISRQNSSINAAQNFSGTVLSGGSASVGAGGTVSGVIVGVGSVSVIGVSAGGLQVLSQNANVNGGSANTLGANAPPSAASQSAAGTENGNSKDQTTGLGTGDDDPLKKKGLLPTLAKFVKRVTVIL